MAYFIRVEFSFENAPNEFQTAEGGKNSLCHPPNKEDDEL